MKIKTVIYVFVLGTSISACNYSRNKQTKPEVIQSQDMYTCPMHTQIQEQRPGHCPICGMPLVKQNNLPTGTANIPLETLLKPTDEFVVASLPVTTPKQKNINIPVRAYGTIEYDTRSAGSISARISGRIEKMYIKYRYQAVEKGDKIMDVYSPEILTAEENLLFLLQNDASNNSFIQAAREKLLLLGMHEDQLEQVIHTRKPLYAVSIYSNFSGHVHDAGMIHEEVPAASMNPVAPVNQELSLKEGMYIQKGETILMIMNHHRVWAALQIFPDVESLVKTGDGVSLTPETDTADIIKGRIDLIEPFFRTSSKSVTARVYFDNMAMLPVGSQVSASIYVNTQRGLWLPQTAVLSLGMTEIAFRKTAGGFMAHKIITGIRSGKDIQVLSGLSAADTIAINGQYFIDSESFIKPSSK